MSDQISHPYKIKGKLIHYNYDFVSSFWNFYSFITLFNTTQFILYSI